MRRFFVPLENFSKDGVVLRGTDVNHIRTVLRLTPGDRIQVLDGLGNRFLVRMTGITPKEIRGKVESKEKFEAEPPLAIQMGMGLLKGNKFDPVVRKAVELGVRLISPLKTERCIVKAARAEADKKTARWRRIALEAAKQSGCGRLPAVSPEILTVEDFCRENREAEIKLIFWEEEETHRLADVSPRQAPRSAAFLTGPEGGFTAAEIAAAGRYGFQPITLGPRILRAETAPLVVLSLLQSRWGDL